MKPIRSCEVFIDGASLGNPGPAGIGAVFLDGDATPIRQLSKYLGETTNNVAEYLALVYALQEACR
ncbi:MAG TPA: RNase H family protein, partial [archaeon]|nr:RNase H family protein [archaeon]